jgi:hypothetical protein
MVGRSIRDIRVTPGSSSNRMSILGGICQRVGTNAKSLSMLMIAINLGVGGLLVILDLDPRPPRGGLASESN